MTNIDVGLEELMRSSVRAAVREADVHAALVGLGWNEELFADPAALDAMVFEEHGAALALSHTLDDVVLRCLGRLRPGTRVAHPFDDRLVALGSLEGATELVLFRDGEVVVVPIAAVVATALPGMAVDTGWLEVSVDGGTAKTVAGNGIEAVAAARRALASELIGVTGAALGVACDHVTTREQYGRPIGSFQSVRHRLAEAYTVLAAAETLVRAAYQDGGAWAAAAAKAQAGAAHHAVIGHCLQVCGAMGLTWEHTLPSLVRRGFLLDIMHGSYKHLTDYIGRELAAGLAPPTVVQL